MTLFWIVVIVLVFWYINKREKRSSVVEDAKEDAPASITEEMLLEAQTKFEKKLEDEIDFPDSIGKRDRYVYWSLMRPWFMELAGKYRYDEPMLQKIRNDWADYLFTTQHFSTEMYLALEFEGEKGDYYDQEARKSGQKVGAIENAFAFQIGDGAVEELKKARALDWSQLSKRGELAPEGFEYTLLGDLIPKQKETV
jgi:hypothetical protein